MAPGAAHHARPSRFPGLAILDSYITRAYVRYVLLSAVALLGIFYIASFLDVSDKLFKGMVTTLTIVNYFRYSTPQWVYYVLPLAVLLGTLVTIAILTKNSELVVMKACGISLYRLALPMFAIGLVAGGGLVLLQETILGPSTRRAEELRAVIRGGNPQTLDLLNNRWLVGSNGQIYHYQSLDPRAHVLTGLDIYEFTPRMERLTRRTFVEIATLAEGESDNVWQIHRGWTREFDAQGEVGTDTPLAAERRVLERPDFFGTEQPNPDHMGYAQLRAYTEKLRAGGFDVTAQDVALWRKSAFPFVPLIMTLLAVPFAADHRPQRRDGRHRHRHRPRDLVLDRDQRVCRVGHWRRAAAHARRLGAESDFRGWCAVPPADGAHVVRLSGRISHHQSGTALRSRERR